MSSDCFAADLSTSGRGSGPGSHVQSPVQTHSERTSTAGPITRPAAVDQRPLAQSMPAVATSALKPRPLSPLVMPKATPAPAKPATSLASSDPQPLSSSQKSATSPAAKSSDPAVTVAPISPRGPAVVPPAESRRSQTGPRAQVVAISSPVSAPRDGRRQSVSENPQAPATPAPPASGTAVPSAVSTVPVPEIERRVSNPPVPEDATKLAARKAGDALSRLLQASSAYLCK
jgi:hypothetical protein